MAATPLQPGPADTQPPYELCIVGGGIAGMNALFSASRYLGPKDRVLLLDQNPRVGGMWNETYDYVRLHQPHPMFTAGNIPWTLGRAPAHLASKTEVLGHFDHCLATLGERVDLELRPGTTFVEHREDADGVDVRLQSGHAAPETVRARRLIKAFGYRIPQNDPLALASERVHSIAPHNEEFAGAAMDASDTPIYVVGGGKTGMDTAGELLRRYPGRPIRLLAGAGTVFLNRNRGFPKGVRRYWSGYTGFRVFRDLAQTFDGDNEAEVIAFFKRHYGIAPHPDCQQYMFGVISEEELAAIDAGLDEFRLDYLRDVSDRAGAPHIEFRSGESHPIAPGTWFVNCTGHLMRQEVPYEPFLSDGGAVLSIQPTSAVHFLTSVASYFLSHLFFLNKLGDLPLYELDTQALARQNKRAFAPAGASHALYNTLHIVGAVPTSVLQEFGLNFDLWYPAHRRLFDFSRLKRDRAALLEHCRGALDRVRDRFGIRCGPLPHCTGRPKEASAA